MRRTRATLCQQQDNTLNDTYKETYCHCWNNTGIGFPPCTYLSNAGARHLYKGGKLNQERYEKGMEAKELFMAIYNYPGRVAVENPVPSRVFGMPLYSQIIQPWEHGDPWTKRTCLWLKDLPLLEPTNIVEPQGTWCVSGTYRKTKDKSKIGAHTTDRARQRAKTFPGIAKAMAEQWGPLLCTKI